MSRSNTNMIDVRSTTHFGSWELALTHLDDLDANPLRWSDEVVRIAGYEPGTVEVTNELFFRLVHPDDREPIRQAVAKAIRERGNYAIVHRLIRPDGEERIIRQTAQTYFDGETGRAVKMIGTAHDITELRRAQEQVQRQQVMLSSAVRIAGLGGWENDLLRDRLEWSDETLRIFGVTRDQFGGRLADFLAFVHPDDRGAMRARHAGALASDGIVEMEYRIIRPDGLERVIYGRGETVFDEAGKPNRMFGMVLDITDRKRVEAELASERDLLRALLNSSTDAIYFKDCGSRFIRSSASMAPRFNLRGPDELIGKTDFEFYGEEHAGRAFADEQEIIRTGRPVTGKMEREIWPDGRVTWSLTSKMPYYNREGQIIGTLGISKDITAFTEAQARLEQLHSQLVESSQLHKSLVETLPQSLFRKDLLGRFTFVNQHFCDTVNRAEADVIGKTAFDLFPPDLAAQFEEEDRQILTTRKPLESVEKTFTADAGVRFIQLVKTPLFDAERNLAGLQGIFWDITERKQLEAQLANERDLLQALLNSSPDPIYFKDRESRFLRSSTGLARFFNLGDAAELIGKSDFDFFGEEHARRAFADEQEIIRTGQPVTGKTERETWPDGRVTWCLSSKMPLRNSQGEIVGTLGISKDITAFREANAKLEQLHNQVLESSRLYKSLVETLPQNIFRKDLEGRFTFVNQNFCRTIGRLEADALGRTDHELFPHDLAAKYQEDDLRIIATGQPFESVEMYQPPGGELSFVQVVKTPLYDARGNVTGLQGIFWDISERKRVEASLRESEERFRLLTENIKVIFWITDATNDRMLYISPAFEAIWGRSCESVYDSPRSWREAIHPEDRERVAQAAEGKQTRGAYDETYRIIRPDGSVRWIHDRAFPVRGLGGEARVSVGTAEDITEGKLAEERVAEQAALLDSSPEAILVKDLEDRIIYWNKGAESTYGWTAFEATGRKSFELIGTAPAPFQEARAALMNRGEWRGELAKRTKGGREITVEVRWKVLRDSRGKPKSILAINADITEKKKLEAQFLRAQRNESLGTLAGGIAHDLNNVLAPIMMSIEMLKGMARDDSDRALLTTLHSSAQRGADLVKQVLAFARGVEGQRIMVNPIHLMRDLLKVIRDTFPKSISMRFTPARDLWTVTGDPTQIHQVFMNLCVNARDAMPDGGILTVTMENGTLDETYAAMNPECRPGAYIIVRVEDTGTGIPSELQSRVFEPFFTTKEIGKGTGLGLSTTLAIVKSHGGFINLYSEPGKGTKFKIYLPANTSTAAAEEVAVEQTRLPRGRGELVLVVDDEEPIRLIAQRTLERFGYRVLLAANGAEAVGIYARNQAAIAVVLTDMAMPIMDGPALIVALKSMNPGVLIIGSSGLAANGGVAKAVDAGVEDFVPKPYSAETMLKTLRKILDRPAGGEPAADPPIS